MLRLVQFLWSGCFHVWEDTSQSTYEKTFGSTGPIVYCKCKKCGQHTHFENATMARPRHDNGVDQ